MIIDVKDQGTCLYYNNNLFTSTAELNIERPKRFMDAV